MYHMYILLCIKSIDVLLSIISLQTDSDVTKEERVLYCIYSKCN